MIPGGFLRFSMAVCALLAALSTAAAADAVPPPNVHLLIAADDVGLACRRFEASEIGAAFCGPDFTPLIKALEAQGRGGPLNLAPLFGLTPEEAMDVPIALAGTVDEIVETLQRRREEYGFSYVVVHEPEMEQFGEAVARLAGT